MCIRTCISCLKQKKIHTHKQKAKESKENRAAKETKEEKEKEILLLLKASVENLTGYDDLVCEFARNRSVCRIRR